MYIHVTASQQTALQHSVQFTSAEKRSKLIFAILPEIYSMYVLIKRNIYLSQGLQEPIIVHLHD